ncbi:hypothetical protein I79_026120 [Cricetulus griseus]|uniref:Uncharacterized protein n=1 Tax=Cricetulus griseus TaxID=10029 RepID=G3IQ32_CRIGR|nr:hypothetical protein I79_026120 [Cricetulus griseus]
MATANQGFWNKTHLSLFTTSLPSWYWLMDNFPHLPFAATPTLDEWKFLSTIQCTLGDRSA